MRLGITILSVLQLVKSSKSLKFNCVNKQVQISIYALNIISISKLNMCHFSLINLLAKLISGSSIICYIFMKNN
ncbi:hypothetical protein BpHYR1_034970 [Brachionus plicatilis]|uniref:Uncharacterized protein n=1 Tax=Brachionus plicatilis TaxID=10195 RepID=A0A3M7S3X5_BRAPC|nr:hypothetical protein BpHYR1_034970 [Brachionus plicatilis]